MKIGWLELLNLEVVVLYGAVNVANLEDVVHVVKIAAMITFIAVIYWVQMLNKYILFI
jgi:hypothetical protein